MSWGLWGEEGKYSGRNILKKRDFIIFEKILGESQINCSHLHIPLRERNNFSLPIHAFSFSFKREKYTGGLMRERVHFAVKKLELCSSL